jgi:hypothetical protein
MKRSTILVIVFSIVVSGLRYLFGVDWPVAYGFAFLGFLFGIVDAMLSHDEGRW